MRFDTWDSSSAVEHPAQPPFGIRGAALIFIITISPRQTTLTSPPRGSRPGDSASDSDTPTRCSVTGNCPAARLHGNIQGCAGTKPGASLRFVQRRCLLLLRHEQGENAPVSTSAPTAHTQALNYLLRSDNVRRIGDVTVVYWGRMPILPSPHLRELCFSVRREQSDWAKTTF